MRAAWATWMVVGALTASPCAVSAQNLPPRTATSADYQLEVQTIARGLENPWGLAFLPDGRALVTERPGRLRVVGRDGRLSAPVKGSPEVHAVGQGGLLGIALDPRFVENRLVYLSFAERRGSDTNSTSVFRGRLNVDATALENGRIIYRQQPAFASRLHFGSRIVFDRTGASVRHLRRPLLADTGSPEPGQHHRQDRPHHHRRRPRWRRSGGLAARDLVDRPSQHAGRGSQSGNRRTLDQQPWAARRRWPVCRAGRSQLRLAADLMGHAL